jgi:hypothetical protein
MRTAAAAVGVRPSVTSLLLADDGGGTPPLARATTSRERQALRHLLGETLASLLPRVGALDESLAAAATHPCELTRADLAAGRLAPGSHWITHKVDGENFLLVYMPPSIASALTPAAAATAGQKRPADEPSADAPGIVFLVGAGDAPGAERSYRLVEPTTLSFWARVRGTLAPLDLPLVYDGELAVRRVHTPDERPRERERSVATYGWTATPRTGAEAAARLDTGVVRRHSLVYVVADCLYAGRVVVGTQLLQLRAATSKASLVGTDPARRPPAVAGTPARLELVYKPHQPGYDAAMLVRDLAEPALVGCDLDGLVLTPATTPFRAGNDPALYKLKPPALKTLDLRVGAVSETHVRMYSCALGACRRSPTCDVHALGDAPRTAFERVGIDTRAPSFANSIVEFSPEYAAASDVERRDGRFAWTPVRPRPDKQRPNARRTLESTFAALRDAVRYDEVVAALARPPAAASAPVPAAAAP